MRDLYNIRQLEEFSPDFMGFIFYPKSPRYVGESPIIPKLSSKINKVGVFVNENPESVIEKAKKHHLNYVQLHGAEGVEIGKQIKSQGIRIIKAVSISTDFDFKTLSDFIGIADYFLFDTPGSGYGGHGHAFDWDILNQYPYDTPFLIAGGVSPENISALLGYSHPQFYGIDVNSKFEVSPGLKDIEALKKLFLQVRTTEV